MQMFFLAKGKTNSKYNTKNSLEYRNSFRSGKVRVAHDQCTTQPITTYLNSIA